MINSLQPASKCALTGKSITVQAGTCTYGTYWYRRYVPYLRYLRYKLVLAGTAVPLERETY